MRLDYFLLFFIINTFGKTQSVDEQCGTLNEELIYSKTHVATPEEFPWTAHLGYRRKIQDFEIIYDVDAALKLQYNCQGVLISKRAILATHFCLKPRDGIEIVSVTLGYVNKMENCNNNPECLDFPQHYDIEEVILNANFNMRKFSGDIGMLRLEKDVTFGQYIQPICLPSADFTQNDLITKNLHLAGYPFNRNELNITKTLVQIVSPERCQKLWNGLIELKSEHICGLIEDQLQFSTGAPLMDVKVENNKPQHFYLVGLLSGGKLQPDGITPDLFANVVIYLDWIKENM